MTPLGIEILLWHLCTRGQYRGGDFSAPAVRELLDEFTRRGLLIRSNDPEQYTANYEALEIYMEALCGVPLPKLQWVIAK